MAHHRIWPEKRNSLVFHAIGNTPCLGSLCMANLKLLYRGERFKTCFSDIRGFVKNYEGGKLAFAGA